MELQVASASPIGCKVCLWGRRPKGLPPGLVQLLYILIYDKDYGEGVLSIDCEGIRRVIGGSEWLGYHRFSLFLF
jgi:hypothetical protein